MDLLLQELQPFVERELGDAKVRVTLEIEVEIPKGMPDSLVRTVRENSRELKFSQAEFEQA